MFQSDTTREDIGITLAIFAAIIFVFNLVILFSTKQLKPERLLILIFNLLAAAIYVLLGTVLGDADHFESYYQPLWSVHAECFAMYITTATVLCLWILGVDYETPWRLQEYVERTAKASDNLPGSEERAYKATRSSFSYVIRQYAQVAVIVTLVLIFVMVITTEWIVTVFTSTYLIYISIGFVTGLVVVVGVFLGMLSNPNDDRHRNYELGWNVIEKEAKGAAIVEKTYKRSGAPLLMYAELKQREIKLTKIKPQKGVVEGGVPREIFASGVFYTLPNNNETRWPYLQLMIGRKAAFLTFVATTEPSDPNSKRNTAIYNKIDDLSDIVEVSDPTHPGKKYRSSHPSTLQRKYRNFRGKLLVLTFFATVQLLFQAVFMWIDWAFSTQGWTQFRDLFWVLTQFILLGFMTGEGFDYIVNPHPLELDALPDKPLEPLRLPVVMMSTLPVQTQFQTPEQTAASQPLLMATSQPQQNVNAHAVMMQQMYGQGHAFQPGGYENMHAPYPNLATSAHSAFNGTGDPGNPTLYHRGVRTQPLSQPPSRINYLTVSKPVDRVDEEDFAAVDRQTQRIKKGKTSDDEFDYGGNSDFDPSGEFM